MPQALKFLSLFQHCYRGADHSQAELLVLMKSRFGHSQNEQPEQWNQAGLKPEELKEPNRS